MDLGKRIDLHTHTFLSDGALIPSELIRQAEVAGYQAIALTDHVDASNLEDVINKTLKLLATQQFNIQVIPGVELSYVSPKNIPELAKEAKKLGAKIVVVHGESEAFDEPVYPGTNLAAVETKDFVDILAHPGKITEAEAKLAQENNVYLELSSKKVHAVSNKHIAKIALKVSAKLLVNTDTHRPEDLLNQENAFKVAKAAGLSDQEAKIAIWDNPQEIINKL